MRIDAKTLNILANRIQQSVKKNDIFSRDEKPVQYSKINVIHHISRLKKVNHMINQCRKSIGQNLIPIRDLLKISEN